MGLTLADSLQWPFEDMQFFLLTCWLHFSVPEVAAGGRYTGCQPISRAFQDAHR